MGQISSAEIADIMLRQRRFLMVSEIVAIASAEYPELTVTRMRVANIIRCLMTSERAVCEIQTQTYPRRYCLHGICGYQFKSRGRRPEFEHLVVDYTTKSSIEEGEAERRRLVAMANKLWNQSIRSRKASHE
ncbi:late promoter activating protein [Klebsiella michiganensis]|nr:late promoter activating protein [Klebsiella michiganensis]